MRRIGRRLGLAVCAASVLAFQATPVAAADGGEINSGDTAWLLTATSFVMVMLPGLALFYGGLVRRKNVLSTIMHSFFVLALVSVVWVLWGYSLAFGPDAFGGLIGGLQFAGFSGVTGEVDTRYAATIPHVLFAGFQLMFAAITPALISGAFAERKRFAAFAIFTLLWSTLVYSPLAHWVWAPGGWLRTLGALDFAGGTVVHISSGVSALVVALVIGRRTVNGAERFEPHDVPMTVLGAGLLWFGWFGFNGGSALAANGVAANALIVTNTAAGAATLTWVLASWLHKGKASVVGAATGAIAGLVAITPAAGFVTAGGAVLIGLMAGAVCYGAILLRERLRVDDALDVWAVHGVGGTLGAIGTGIFAVAAVGGMSGAIEGNLGQVGIQLVAVAATWAFAAGATFLIALLIKLILGLRVAPSDEELGLDLAVHGEAAYQG
jgi:Amt family ammonium transporter